MYSDGSLKWLAKMDSAEMLNCKFLAYSICTLHDVMEITTGLKWENSSQNFCYISKKG
jgi:hypothetical protein